MTEAASIQILGAADTVTGSRFMVQSGRSRVLVDCGMFQGRRAIRQRNWAPFPVDPASIDSIVISHAHLDHVGFVPALVRGGFTGSIFATQPTAELASIVLRDSARLQEEEAAYANRKGFSRHHPALPLYTQDDVEIAEGLLVTVDYDDAVDVAPDVRAVLRPAGHILGSSTIELRLDAADRNVLFTGDLGRANHPLLTPPADPPAADFVVTESTYGDRAHDDEEGTVDALADVVNRTAERGGSVIIPAFAVDRTEVVLASLGQLVSEGRIPRLPIHADSPMALAVLDVYRRAIGDRDASLRRSVSADVFDIGGELHEVPTTEGSRALNEMHFPSIIVSASGMATGGRVLHHLANRLPDRRNAVVLVGFQAPGTRGQQLADGARAVKLFGQYVSVRAEVLALDDFSVHADADELVAWHARMPAPPTTAFAVHGEPAAAAALAARLTEDLDWTAVVPSNLERVRLR